MDANGNFAFRKVPETSESVLLEIALQKKGNRGNFLSNETPMASNYMPVVWQPGETLEITASVDHFQQSFSLQNPSEANAELLKLRDIKLEAFQQYLGTSELESKRLLICLLASLDFRVCGPERLVLSTEKHL